jgi:hypothetical protein
MFDASALAIDQVANAVNMAGVVPVGAEIRMHWHSERGISWANCCPDGKADLLW